MSYKSREKKRRRKLAQANVRSKHGETMKSRHYLTITTRACCCNDCGRRLRRGDESVFRFEPKEIVCLTCAEELDEDRDPSVCPECEEVSEEYADEGVCPSCGYEKSEEDDEEDSDDADDKDS